MKKLISRGSLLKSDGKTLCEIGYADKLVKSYNLKDIKGKGIDKFRENFEIIYYESGFCFVLNVVRHRLFGETKIMIFDFVNRQFEEKRVVEIFACKKYSLSKQGEIHIKNRELLLNFVDGKKKKLKLLSSDQSNLKLDVEISNKIPMSIVTTNQFDDGFDYARSSIGYIAKGFVNYGNRKINLYGNKGAIVAYNGRLATSKTAKQHRLIYAEGEVCGKGFALIIDTLSDENSVCSSMLLYDGYTYKLDEVIAGITTEYGYKLLGKDDNFSINFYRHFVHLNNSIKDSGIEFGKIKGRIKLKNGDLITFENIGAVIAYNSRIM